MFQYLSHSLFGIPGMPDLAPDLLAAGERPGIQFREATKALLTGFLPDAAPAVLDVLLHYTLRPSRGYVAEVRVEQVVGRHGGKLARISLPLCGTATGGMSPLRSS